MTMKVGLIGCGNIADVYLSNAKLFRDIEFVAVSSRRSSSAEILGAKYVLPVLSVEALIADQDIDIVLNLTPPHSHAELNLAAIEAGKHVYTEKPLATSLFDGKRIGEAARAKGLSVGCAPDTLLGGGIQTARATLDEGQIGRPLIGVASVLNHGMENWHPSPDFFFQPGGGPVFDVGPYYITALITLLGPISKVSAIGVKGFVERIVTATDSPHYGRVVPVNVLTSVQAHLHFASDAQISFLASWDVWRTALPAIELHGTEGSMQVPDPDYFGGTVRIARGQSNWVEVDSGGKTFGYKNWPAENPVLADFRGLGLAEMARAISEGRSHRTGAELSIHTLAVMSGIIESAERGMVVDIKETCKRPEVFSEVDAKELLSSL
jgi:predicted dehydrogenase